VRLRGIAVAALLLLAGCRTHNPLALADAARFPSDFDRARGETRVVLLISPT
jgi:hypothetical protein